VAFKNVTVSEDYFQGHFPGTPLMPAVLMIEALTQVAAALILDHAGPSQAARVSLRGVNAAKFRRNVFPGDRLNLEVTLGRTRSRLVKVHAQASVDGQLVAEAELLLAVELRVVVAIQPAWRDPRDRDNGERKRGQHSMMSNDRAPAGAPGRCSPG